MTQLLRMYEESQQKLEAQIRENTEVRLKLQEHEMADERQITSGVPQPQDLLDQNQSVKMKNEQLKRELKTAYGEIAELRQTLAMRDRKIGQLQSKLTVQAMESGKSPITLNSGKGKHLTNSRLTLPSLPRLGSSQSDLDIQSREMQPRDFQSVQNPLQAAGAHKNSMSAAAG